MKIKGKQVTDHIEVWCRKAVDINKVVDSSKGVLISLSGINKGDDFNHYYILCENRRVACKVLSWIRSDLKKGVVSINPTGYDKFLDETWGDYVLVGVIDNSRESGSYFRVINGCVVPF